MDNSSRDVPEYYPEDSRPPARNKALKVIIIIALVLIGGLWIWKAIQVSSVKKEAQRENDRIRETAVNLITDTRTEQLRLLAKPFAWALRTEMMRGNMDQVNLYLQDMIKEKNFQRIQVADTRGVVVASTDKKTEGKPVPDAGRVLSADSTVVDNLADSTWLISSPIMGFNNRLGTLLINYANPKPTL